jgi:Leucine-rich repeat (LRR) protein
MSYNKAIVYRADIKFKKNQNINVDNVEWADESIKYDYLNVDTDSINYRMLESNKTKWTFLDLSNMTSTCFEELQNHQDYENIAPNIVDLFINDSELTELPDISHFTKLETLDISNNNIKILPKLPSNLNELSCCNNKIEIIEQFFSRLQILMANNNRLVSIYYPRTLKRLEINDNPNITTIPKLTNLNRLLCNNTRIVELSDFPNLIVLDCINSSVATLGKIPNIKELFIHNTMIQSIDVTNMNQLEEIYASNCNLISLDYCPSLELLVVNLDQNIKLSREYKVKNMVKNKDNNIRIAFYVKNIDSISNKKCLTPELHHF